MARNKIIIGNWKMNLTVPESTLLLERLVKMIKPDKTEVVVCPSFLTIYSAQEIVKTSEIELGAQDSFQEDSGAFTGEVSALDLKGFVKYCLLGHSERRKHFGETDRVVAQKAAACTRHGIRPVICVGESLHERNDGLAKVVVNSQLETALSNLTADEVATAIVAYEPVWAIGTGHVCDPKKANQTIKDIRELVRVLYGKKVSESVHILYGGSIDQVTAPDFLKCSEIDGLLVGGASLDHVKFTEIVEEAEGNQDRMVIRSRSASVQKSNPKKPIKKNKKPAKKKK